MQHRDFDTRGKIRREEKETGQHVWIIHSPTNLANHKIVKIRIATTQQTLPDNYDPRRDNFAEVGRERSASVLYSVLAGVPSQTACAKFSPVTADEY